MDPRPIRLTVVQPNLAPLKLDFSTPMITLGRATECTIPIKDRYLSRRHAEIAFESGQWIVRDCGSVNGTMLNGEKLVAPQILKPGDRIVLGDTEVLFDADESSHSQLIPLDSNSHAKNLAIPAREATVDDSARAAIVSALALQLIEDRPMDQLFEFILDRVLELLHPSRVAVALLSADGTAFSDVRLRRSDLSDSLDLYISRTLLAEVVGERNVVSYVDTSQDEKLARAQSIIAQDIRSAVCAPLLVGDVVRGVLYLDFQANRGAVTPEDVKLIAQIGRFAAVKLETTRLREEAMVKARIEEELKTAYTIQSRLLPAELPTTDGYVFSGRNKPVRHVSGDYFDVVVRPDGRIYFIIADVSGKGITAALVMASVATAFNIFTRQDPRPCDLVREMNVTLAPKTAPTKFVTLVAGVLDPRDGSIEFTNAGHVAPLVVSRDGVTQLTTTDMVVGLFAQATYRTQRVTLEKGDSLVLFTDGVTEAENEAEEQLGIEPVANLLETMHGTDARKLLECIEEHVHTFMGTAPAGDDVTMLAVTRQ
jgi:phosphoserine phosphatase RsbU/P